ncbi:unnamed protein product [Cunninghamella blakesleeana]
MMVLDSIAKQLNLTWTQHRPWKSQMAQTSLSIIHKNTVTNVQLTLIKPRLLMNVSGTCVAKAVKELSITHDNIYIFHDDLQRSLGKLSLKTGGSANGHNGVKSAMEKLGTDAFKRVRIGIGRPDDRSPDVVADFVLNKFTSPELVQIEEMIYPIFNNINGLELLCGRGELWKPNKSKTENKKQKQQKQQKQQEQTPPPSSSSDTNDESSNKHSPSLSSSQSIET